MSLDTWVGFFPLSLLHTSLVPLQFAMLALGSHSPHYSAAPESALSNPTNLL